MLNRAVKNPQIRRALILIADIKNKMKYGWNAPVKYQLLYVKADDIIATPVNKDGVIPFRKKVNRIPDVVMKGDWCKTTKKIEEIFDPGGPYERYSLTKKKMRNEMTWEQLGHKKYTNPDNHKRVDNINFIIKSALESGSIPSEAEINPGKLRELGGIGVMISSTGEILKGSEGFNRLGIAHGLGIKMVPVCILAIHPDAIYNGKWHELHTIHKKHFEKKNKIITIKDSNKKK